MTADTAVDLFIDPVAGVKDPGQAAFSEFREEMAHFFFFRLQVEPVVFLRIDLDRDGLHPADVEKLNEVLSRLVDAGNTLVVIEHNPDVIKTADYLIDMGPEGGDLGGHVVARGTPEQVALCPESYTGQCMRPILGI